MKSPRIPVALEGYPFILLAAFVTLIFSLLEMLYPALGALLATVFVLYFFRDPDRITPRLPGAVISPADGKVIVAGKILDERFTNREVMKISIFMNVFNVHVNRFPLSGTVKHIQFRPGEFYSADTEKGALHNEYCALTIQPENGTEYVVVQVAGLVARRIVCWAEEEDLIKTGERYGLIRFGSRVDLYLPQDIEVSIRKGDTVRAGETVLGFLPDSRTPPA